MVEAGLPAPVRFPALLLATLAARGASLQQEAVPVGAAPLQQEHAALAPAPAALAKAPAPTGCFPTILKGWESGKPSTGRPLRLVMVGNGLTGGVADELIELTTAMGHWTSVQIDKVTNVNFSLGDHVAAAKVDKSRYVPEGVDAVIFQEQSEAPGFFDWARREGGLKTWDTSVESVKYFADLTKQANADMIFLENWGYQDGDIENAIYPTFDVMQNLLTKGSRELEVAAESAALDGRVHVVPVGEVFRRVRSRAAGVNGDFEELFWMQQASGHRKALSKNGQWLAAAVIVRSLIGFPPPLPAGLDALKARLAADIPTGPGPCDGNPQFTAEVKITPQVPEGGARRPGAGAMALLLGAFAAAPALA